MLHRREISGRLYLGFLNTYTLFSHRADTAAQAHPSSNTYGFTALHGARNGFLHSVWCARTRKVATARGSGAVPSGPSHELKN